MEDVEITSQQTEPATPPRFPVVSQLLLLSLVLLLVFGGAYLPKVIADRTDVPEPEPGIVVYREDPTPVADHIEKLSNIHLEARAAYVWDVREQRVLYSKEPDMAWPLASITKLMTALLAFELIDETTPVTINSTALRQDGDSGLLDGEQFSNVTLRDFALLSSSNDAAFALAQAAGSLLSEETPDASFVAGMNIRADELGLSGTQFRNPTGLDISPTQAGAIGTARDVTFLMEYILKEHPEILSSTQNNTSRFYSEDGFYHDAENTNPIVSEVPNLIGSKTGYTDLAGGNLTIVYDAGFNRPIIVTVLGSSYNGRFADVMTLVKAVNANSKIE